MLDGQTAGVEWRATGYRNDFEQMIQWAPNSQGMWIPQNVGKARIEGIKLEGEFDTGWLSHRVSAEYKDPKDQGDRQAVAADLAQRCQMSDSGAVAAV